MPLKVRGTPICRASGFLGKLATFSMCRRPCGNTSTLTKIQIRLPSFVLASIFASGSRQSGPKVLPARASMTMKATQLKQAVSCVNASAPTNQNCSAVLIDLGLGPSLCSGFVSLVMSRPWQSRVHGCTIYVRRPPSVASPSFNAFSADNIVLRSRLRYFAATVRLIPPILRPT